MNFREELNKRIDKINKLKTKKISLAALARKANINNDTLYKFLRGEQAMTTTCLEKIHEALNHFEKGETNA